MLVKSVGKFVYNKAVNTFAHFRNRLIMWFIIFHYRALSTRLLTGIWWVFNVLVITSYIANLTLVLSVHKSDLPYRVESIEELVKHQKVHFGVVQSGSTSSFFRVRISYIHK